MPSVEGLNDGVDASSPIIELRAYMKTFNYDRPHQGCGMNGRMPAKAFSGGLPKPIGTTKMEKTRTKKAA